MSALLLKTITIAGICVSMFVANVEWTLQVNGKDRPDLVGYIRSASCCLACVCSACWGVLVATAHCAALS